MKIIKTIIISTFSCLFLFSCQEDKQYVYKYYEDGSIHKKIEAISDTVPHGEWIEYYRNRKVKLLTSFDSGYNEGFRREYYANGNIKSILPMRKSKIQGFAKAFYANGNILWSGRYINGVRDGIFKEYYENDSGRILRERYFAFNPIINEDNLYAAKEYDKNGNITKYERIIDLVSNLDTIKVGEVTYLNVKIVEPIHDNIDVLLGDFDELFNLPENFELDTVKGQNGIVRIPVSFNKKGKHRLRLLVRDYMIEQDKDTTISTALHNYVFYDFYVR